MDSWREPGLPGADVLFVLLVVGVPVGEGFSFCLLFGGVLIGALLGEWMVDNCLAGCIIDIAAALVSADCRPA